MDSKGDVDLVTVGWYCMKQTGLSLLMLSLLIYGSVRSRIQGMKKRCCTALKSQ